MRGAENIPADGGALVVSNHSGTVPVDGLMTMVSIHDHTGRNLRPLGADLVFRLPLVGELARKGGATLACNEDAAADAAAAASSSASGPRGSRASASPTPSATSCSASAAAASSPRRSAPASRSSRCSVVGAEEIYPLVGNVPSLARLLGVPYLPITPFFPLLGPLGLVPLPSKWLIEFGEPIRTDAYDEGAADDPMLVFNVTDQVRETIQQTLYSLLHAAPLGLLLRRRPASTRGSVRAAGCPGSGSERRSRRAGQAVQRAGRARRGAARGSGVGSGSGVRQRARQRACSARPARVLGDPGAGEGAARCGAGRRPPVGQRTTRAGSAPPARRSRRACRRH